MERHRQTSLPIKQMAIAEDRKSRRSLSMVADMLGKVFGKALKLRQNPVSSRFVLTLRRTQT
jgi:hypothetical protein